MKRKELEIKLEQLRDFENPSAALEQYSTPSIIASDILFSAYANNEVEEKIVSDFGCGTGIFCIGAKILGASVSRGYDVSEEALKIAKENAKSLDAEIVFKKCDVLEINEKSDTVFMNPPFGCQNKHADRPFLKKAMTSSDSVYSIHMADTEEFLDEFVASCGKEIVARGTYKYNIPHTFSFHSKTKKEIDIIVVNIR